MLSSSVVCLLVAQLRCSAIAYVTFLNDSAGWLKQGWLTGGYHELMKGPEKVEVLDSIVKWILAHSTASVEANATTPSA